MRHKKDRISSTSAATHTITTQPGSVAAGQIQAAQRDAALSLKHEVNFHDILKDGSPGPEMVVIPPGTFLMGSPDAEHERAEDEHQHAITIGHPFAMGRYAVTFAEYDAFCDATGQKKPLDMGWGREQHPVINVTWNDALDYCEWLYIQTGHSYWLPTEAEWEYCCRAGTTTPFYFGSSLSPTQAHYEDDHISKTQAVGNLPPNALGLYEMHGNVWEWTCSEYEKDYRGAETECSQSKYDLGLRVYRGGSWLNKPTWLRSAARSHRNPGHRHHNLGFRLTMMF